MLKISALALLGAMTFTTAARMHGTATFDASPVVTLPAATNLPNGLEKLEVVFSPLDSTEVARYLGLGKAFHMALVYTDRDGISRGASSGPSALAVAQTPALALDAMLASFHDEPSAFGTLASDPDNNKPFMAGSEADHFSKDGAGQPYIKVTVLRGDDLSARWASILQTYARTAAMGLSYSPVSQNSNSLAATALARAGIRMPYSSETVFAPGAFTELP